MGKIKIGNLLPLVPVWLLISACGTTGSEHTTRDVTPGARITVEAAQPADAGSGASASAKSAKLADDDPDKVICRADDAPTGTRLGKRRICATRAEWDALSASSRADVERIQDGSKYCVPSPTSTC